MMGPRIVAVACDAAGNIDAGDLGAIDQHRDQLAR